MYLLGRIESGIIEFWAVPKMWVKNSLKIKTVG